MIVTCTSCKTRLRVSEERIGPKGARLRCSRCENVFVIPPEPAGGVAADPPYTLEQPELEQLLPSPGANAARAASDLEVPADPFGPGPPGPSSHRDPFAAAPPPVTASLRPVPPPLPRTSEDFFSAPAPAAHAKQEDPFGAGLGWDPFGVAEPAPGPVSEVQTPARGRATTNMTELLEPSEPARPPADLGSLALEERETPQPRAARPSYEETDLDLGFGMPDVLGAPEGDHLLSPGGVPASYSAPADEGAPRVQEPTPFLGGGEPPTSPVSSTREASAPAEAADANPVPAPVSEVRGGRLAVAMTNSFSLALLIAAAAALFLAWQTGLVGRMRGALARGAPAPAVEASGVTGGLYDTASGSAVLVVRGRIGAHGALAGPVRVRVELVDGARVVASAAGLAGAAATAEQVYGAGTAEDAAALRRALDALAATRLAAGDNVPFLIVFPPPAPDPRGLALRVEAEPAPATVSTGG